MDLLNIYNFMNKKLMMDKTGHGISHIKRVENIAKKIASEEKIQNKEWEIIGVQPTFRKFCTLSKIRHSISQIPIR
ncbi:hypothetical protein [Staphylococcus capitis]